MKIDNQKSLIIIVAVLIAGLLVGSFVTGQAARRRPPGHGPGPSGPQTMEIRDGDLITKDNYLFYGDSNCYNNDPNDMDCWKFSIGELYAGPPTVGNMHKGEKLFKGPTVQVENSFYINKNTNSIGISPGQQFSRCVFLPNNYTQICLEELKESSYTQLYVRYDGCINLSQGGTPTQTCESVVTLYSNIERGFNVTGQNFYQFGRGITSTSIAKTTNIILIHINSTTPRITDIFYQDNDVKFVWAGSINFRNFDPTYYKFATFNYRNTNGSDFELNINRDYYYKVSQVVFYSWDELHLTIKDDDLRFLGFGEIPMEAELNDLTYGYVYGIGTKTIDLRNLYGNIVKTPKTYLDLDTLTFDVSGDNLLVLTAIKKCNSVNGQIICSSRQLYLPTDNSTITGTYPNHLPSELNYTEFGISQNAQLGNKDYAAHSELDIGRIPPYIMNFTDMPFNDYNNAPILTTSLASSNDAYGTGVFLHVPSRSITYSYIFDQDIPLNTTSASKPLTISMLGKTLKIVNINSDNSFTIEKIYQ